MDTQPGPGVTADSPAAPSFSDYEKAANAADLGSSSESTARADSSPAPSGDQSASTDASTQAASETAPPPDTTPKKGIQTRTQQLDAEVQQLQEKLKLRKALREELDSLDRPAPATQAASQPAPPTQAEHVRYQQHPHAPKAEQFDTYEEFVAAMGVFIADQRFEEREQRTRLDAQSRERVSSVQQTITGFSEKLAAARTADPEFDQKVDPGLFQLTPAFALAPGVAPRAANVLIQACVESDVSVALLQHFSTPAGQQEWAGLAAAPTPAAMLRQFGRIEARFASDGPTAEQPAKAVSSAPTPPTTLGTKPPQSADRAGAAVKAGDYRGYEAAANAADLAVRRR